MSSVVNNTAAFIITMPVGVAMGDAVFAAAPMFQNQVQPAMFGGSVS